MQPQLGIWKRFIRSLLGVDTTTIEFGAHQVIIVQSEEAKKALPDVLQAGIGLTVFEAKGLELDDVLHK